MYPGIQQEVNTYNKLLSCKFGSCQEQTKEILAAIDVQLLAVSHKNVQVFPWFVEKFNKIMEDNNCLLRHPFTQDRIMISMSSKVLEHDELSQFQSISNLLSICAWIMGSFLCYQPADKDAVNLYKCLEILLNKQIKAFCSETAAVYLLAAFKAFIGLFYQYNANNMFTDTEACKNCAVEEYFGEFAVIVSLTEQEIQQEKQKLERQKNERLRTTDTTFMSEA